MTKKMNERKWFILGRIDLNICPVYYSKHDNAGDSFFIMENLKEIGYFGSVDKIPGLDFEHCKIVLQELARSTKLLKFN